MNTRNPIEVMFELFMRLIEWSSAAWDFIFTDHTIGLRMLEINGEYLIDFSITLNLFDALLGGLGLTILIFALVKLIIPVA